MIFFGCWVSQFYYSCHYSCLWDSPDDKAKVCYGWYYLLENPSKVNVSRQEIVSKAIENLKCISLKSTICDLEVTPKLSICPSGPSGKGSKSRKKRSSDPSRPSSSKLPGPEIDVDFSANANFISEYMDLDKETRHNIGHR